MHNITSDVAIIAYHPCRAYSLLLVAVYLVKNNSTGSVVASSLLH
jgi:hypothetical protein